MKQQKPTLRMDFRIAHLKIVIILRLRASFLRLIVLFLKQCYPKIVLLNIAEDLINIFEPIPELLCIK